MHTSKWNPNKDEYLSSGDKITLYIPDIEEEYPDMNAEGWGKEDAQTFCDKYGIKLTIKEQETTQYEEGKVIGQSRAAGSPIAKGSTLTITIAKKPTEKKPEVEEDEEETEESSDAESNENKENSSNTTE